MTALRGLISLGDAENLWDTKWTGWAHAPGRRTPMKLLANEDGSTQNEVIQEGSLGFRRGRLSFTAQGRDQRDLVRDYDEGSEQVAFVDEDGSTCGVLVDKYESSWMFADLWHVDVDLIQLSDPVPAGSGSSSGSGS